MTAQDIHTELHRLADPETAAFLQGFFKTGPGEYGEGDLFLGIRVPVVRRVAGQFRTLPLPETTALLRSPQHEARLTALLILVAQYRKGDEFLQQQIYETYLAHTGYVNNWDLVDSSAEHIIGAHLLHRDRAPLYDLARSPLLWDRRIAILSTFHYIKQRDYADTFGIAEILLHDPHDLIHKAVGWMLREIGNRDLDAVEAFLRTHYRTMPRTMLRYAIERFPEDLRKAYLNGDL